MTSSSHLGGRPAGGSFGSGYTSRRTAGNSLSAANNAALIPSNVLSSSSAGLPAHLDDSLEYFIKFPTPNFRNREANELESGAESDFVFVYNETNVPIVMLLGWAGCQDRYLMKYSKIYEDRG